MRTFSEHKAETLELGQLQTIQLHAYLSAAKQDGEDTSTKTWADVVAAGWDKITELDALRIIAKALRIVVFLLACYAGLAAEVLKPLYGTEYWRTAVQATNASAALGSLGVAQYAQDYVVTATNAPHLARMNVLPMYVTDTAALKALTPSEVPATIFVRGSTNGMFEWSSAGITSSDGVDNGAFAAQGNWLIQQKPTEWTIDVAGSGYTNGAASITLASGTNIVVEIETDAGAITNVTWTSGVFSDTTGDVAAATVTQGAVTAGSASISAYETSVAIAAGKATWTTYDLPLQLYQSITMPNGNTDVARITGTVVDMTAGTLSVYLGNDLAGTVSANGDFEFVVTPDSSTEILRFLPSTSFDGSLDDVVLTQETEDDVNVLASDVTGFWHLRTVPASTPLPRYVSTLTDLATTSTTTGTSNVFVLDTLAGGEFIAIAGGTYANTSGVIYTNTASGNQWMRREFVEGKPLNPMWLGAVPGADSTTAIRDTIVLGASLGRAVSIPTTTDPFLISTITISSNDVVLLGPGKLKKDTSNSTMFSVTGDRLTIDGVKFDGNMSNIVSPSSTLSVLVYLTGSHDTKVRNCYFTRSAGHALRITDSVGVVAEDNTFYDVVLPPSGGTGSAIYINGTSASATTGTLIKGNKIRWVGWRAMEAAPTWPFSVSEIEDANGIQIQDLGTYGQVSGVTLVGNLIEYCGSRAIKIQSSDVIAEANNVRNCYGGIRPMPGGAGMRNVVIKGNDISYVNNAISPGGSTSIDSVWVEGNTMRYVVDVLGHQSGITVNFMSFKNNDVSEVQTFIHESASSSKLKRFECVGNRFKNWAMDLTGTTSERVAFYGLGYTDYQWTFTDNYFETESGGNAYSAFRMYYPSEPCYFARNRFNLVTAAATDEIETFAWESGTWDRNLILEDNVDILNATALAQANVADRPARDRHTTVPDLKSMAALNPTLYDSVTTLSTSSTYLRDGVGQIWYPAGATNVPAGLIGAPSTVSFGTTSYRRTNAVRFTAGGTDNIGFRYFTNATTIGQTYRMTWKARALSTGWAFTNAYLGWTSPVWATTTNVTTAFTTFDVSFEAATANAASATISNHDSQPTNTWWLEVKDLTLYRTSETPATNTVDCIASTTSGWVWLPTKPPINITATAPTVPYTGQLWISNAVQTFLYNGTVWLPLSNTDGTP